MLNQYFVFFVKNPSTKVDLLLGCGIPIPNFFWHKSFHYGQIRLHPKFHLPKSSGSALKVCGGVVGWGGVVAQTNNHYHASLSFVELSCIELRVDQFEAERK